MLSALRTAACSILAGSATATVAILVLSAGMQTTPIQLLSEYWFVYVPAVTLPAAAILAHAAVNNWLAAGDPQKTL